MPRKSRSLSPPNEGEPDLFARHVEAALEHIGDDDWLSEHSPLAAPYFLGQALSAQFEPFDRPQQGVALRRVLQEAAATLESDLQELLHVVYFERNPHLENVGLALTLHMSERTFYRTRTKAIGALASALNNRLLPSMRDETPIQRALIGRPGVLERVMAVLRSGRTFFLFGPGGMGKTTVGAVVWHQWSEIALAEQRTAARRVFWYTLRPEVNDQAASLLFAIGSFLRAQGASALWRQLVADRGLSDLSRALALLRYDLESLPPATLLFCFDDVDVLLEENREHIQIIHLLEDLRTGAPLLLIGQRVTLENDEHLRLPGLDAAGLADLLAQIGAPPISGELQTQLLTITRGNPALALLFTMLLRDGDDAASALHALAQAPAVEVLFNRLWRRLRRQERELLMQLAVYRTPAPRDVWHRQSDLLAQLQQRELVQSFADGSVALPPHLHRITYERIPTEVLPLLHRQAADVYEARADYVSAMYHAVRGQQAARAVWLWYVHRHTATDAGRGAAALQILLRIAPADLPDDHDRAALRVARAELLALNGQSEEAAEELQFTVTAPHSLMRAYVRRYEASLLETQGRVQQALQKYREAIDLYTDLPQLGEVAARTQLSFLQHYRLHHPQQARREALLARAKADAFLGDLESIAGRYDAALDYLLSAKSKIESAGGELRDLSRVYSYLGTLYYRRADDESALHYLNQAIECDRQRGDQIGPLYDLLTRAAVHTMAGRHAQGLADAQQGLQSAERFKNSYLVAGFSAGVAEALLGLQRWSEAEYYAQYSLGQEEEFFRAAALVVLALIRCQQDQYAESLQLLAAALENAQQIEDRHTEAYIWKAFAQVYTRIGEPHQARDARQSALGIFKALGNRREMAALEPVLLQDE
jgi:tetratricopeptide (TPR) repeat protein